MAAENNYIEPTELAGVFVIKRPVFNDDRGFFREVFRKQDLEQKLEKEINFVQANHSRSSFGTLRGVHTAPWYKLITVPHGQVQQVVVDLRPNSETFGKHISFILGEEIHHAILVPPGFGNAYLVLSESADYFYNVTDYWAAGKEQDVLYSDPDLKINWQNSSPNLSEKDSKAKTVKELFPNKF